MKQNNVFYLILAIGLMTVGQLPAGIYLPSMISMGKFFNVSHGPIQYILSIYLLAYGASQIVYGPISDHYGRKPTAIAGLLLFSLGCILSTLSKNILIMYVGSLIQGIGLGSVAVISKAVIRDIYEDQKLLSAASYMSAATIVTPLAAPILGSYLQVHFDWHATFLFLLGYGIFILTLISFYFKETHAYTNSERIKLFNFFRNYKSVLQSKNFPLFALCRILAISGGTAYAANSPFLFQTLLHLSPVEYAWISVIPACGFFIGSFLAKKFGNYFSINGVVNIGALFLFFGSFILLILALTFPISIFSIVIPMLIYMCGSGIIFPSAFTGALLPLGALAGTATAMIGSFQNLGRGFFSSFVGYFHSYSQLPLAITLTGISFICLLITICLLCYQESRQKVPS